MIRLVEQLSTLAPFAGDAFGCRIAATQQMYPQMYSVQSWVQHGGKIAIGKSDSSLTVAHLGGAKTIRQREMNELLYIVGGETVLMPFAPDTPAADGFALLDSGPVMRLSAPAEKCFDDSIQSPSVSETFALLCENFPNTGGDAQYTDLSYRVRHGGSRLRGIFVDEKLVACAITSAETESSAIISGVCCRSEYRKSGYASRLVRALSAELTAEGKQVFLFTSDSLIPFYQRLGFSVSDSWYLYQL